MMWLTLIKVLWQTQLKVDAELSEEVVGKVLVEPLEEQLASRSRVGMRIEEVDLGGSALMQQRLTDLPDGGEHPGGVDAEEQAEHLGVVEGEEAGGVEGEAGIEVVEAELGEGGDPEELRRAAVVQHVPRLLQHARRVNDGLLGRPVLGSFEGRVTDWAVEAVVADEAEVAAVGVIQAARAGHPIGVQLPPTLQRRLDASLRASDVKIPRTKEAHQVEVVQDPLLLIV
eukprot:CAMPEP_0196653750 /NCGR_PEP_ID=MMETSP1086-20130531/3400_1 /TAXON_ID=77921 /ORGANISM="Cyanoptyche  gloeocystis , Strain SAG4.97" /LENGTH=227 /DNA_ID=CAMNT_0041985101 /DNA_START=80 /DNA_END=764 /DNA_ORIENTATION=-